MRTLIVATFGVVLAFAFAFVRQLLGRAKSTGALVFLGLWLIFCVVDYANGVKAGYSATEEFGIHTLIFVVPALTAWFATRLLP